MKDKLQGIAATKLISNEKHLFIDLLYFYSYPSKQVTLLEQASKVFSVHVLKDNWKISVPQAVFSQ